MNLLTSVNAGIFHRCTLPVPYNQLSLLWTKEEEEATYIFRNAKKLLKIET